MRSDSRTFQPLSLYGSVPSGGTGLLRTVLAVAAAAMRDGRPLLPVLQGIRKDAAAGMFPASPGLGRRLHARFPAFIRALEAGLPFTEALRAWLGPWLQPSVYAGLAAAEKNGRLADVLPAVLDHLELTEQTRVMLRAAIAYPVIQAVTGLSIISGLMIFIVPRFFRIMEEMVDARYSPLQSLVMATAGTVTRNAPYFLLLSLLLVLAVVVLRATARRHAGFGAALDALLFRLPLFGPLHRRLCLLDFVRNLGILLTAQLDMVSAATLSRDACQSHWMRRRADLFLEKLQAGVPWVEAWACMELKAPFAEWILRNGAARENPADAFRFLSLWLRDDATRATHRAARWLEPGLVLLNALVIGTVVFAVFTMLIQLIWYTMNG